MTDAQIISALSTVVMSLAGYIAYQWREQAKKSEEREKWLQDRLDGRTSETSDLVGQLVQTTKAMSDSLDPVVEYVIDQRAEERLMLKQGRPS